MINLSGYDFIDFGSGFGGCIDFAKKKLFGKNELGFEKHFGRYSDLRKKGYHCLNRDITKIDLTKNSVRFATISHVLEHLNTKADVKKVVKIAIHAATDFVFIEGPSFEFDDYLENLGLKFLWRDGHGHYVKPRIDDIIHYAKSYGVTNYSLLTERPYIVDSSSKDIHPLESPPNVQDYNPKIHPPKKKTIFNPPIFRSFIIFLWLNEKFDRHVCLTSRVKFRESNYR